MNLEELIQDLLRHGICLKAEGEQLRYYPRSALTTEQLEGLKAHKAGLIARLQPESKAVEPIGAEAKYDVAEELEFDWGPWPSKADLQEKSGLANQSGPFKYVCRCGSNAYCDVVIESWPHNGDSVRRDCARCGRFHEYVVWYGKSYWT
jgi:hypothetical protein